ncbi:MAG: nucleoside 2-deoxyribosyltransferase [Candidatus Pacebacteria bacterium]|nr:nucleoside 2-deoxyribosyltransferase [Candidatus Paceibacterota bacterium]MCD8508377.1 nucleoside 2-deoxyribosyltransferase [Candidatus Paceibacterota bacterium]MCD8527770.1 nucleoside 2-deoxyribosyltransferase [Candidatus Paceibacterota bacterium]MCD8563690.1 nucleoside 2-deoxyribosyltransferase [Candidatus Paceibacterota bacterium]
MKIVITHATTFPFEQELYAPLMAADFFSEHEFLLPQRTGLAQQITEDMIRTADVVICEVSLPSTGQGIEIGWATAHKTPCVCIHKKDAHISGALQYVCDVIIPYRDTQDMVEQVRRVCGASTKHQTPNNK